MPRKSMDALEELVGRSYRTIEGLEIEADKVEEFARAVGDDNPAHRDPEAAERQGFTAIPAPLTFTRTAYFPRYRPAGVDVVRPFDLGFRREHRVHGEQEYEFERPVRVGDVLSGEVTLTDVYQREGDRGGSMTFAVFEIEYRDRGGDLVLTERQTVIETSGGADESDGTTGAGNDRGGERGRTTRAYAEEVTPGDLSVGDAGPEVVVGGLERADFVRYAGASGDFNPIHYDEPYAKAAGYPSVFGQGMLTAGVAAHAAADWLGLANVERFRTRFGSKVWPGDTLVVTTEVTEVTTTGGAERVTASIDVRNQTDASVLTGSVTATITEREGWR